MRARNAWRRPLVVVAAATAIIATSVAGLGLLRGWWRFNHPDPTRFRVWGIDVSHHQGEVDWAAVAKDDRLAFAYIKATEGGDFVDPRFAENWSRARRAGLKVGAYHFFTFCRPALEQAQNFLSVVERDPAALPPALDLEYGGTCRERPAPAAVRRELAIWLAEVERATSRRPIVYVTGEAYQHFLAGSGLPHSIWIRDVFAEPTLDGAPWTFWQFANRGRVLGIRTPVDLDVFAGERAGLDGL